MVFCAKFGTVHNFVYIIVLKWLKLQKIIIGYKLRAKLQFGTYAQKVAQIWFVLHETLHTTIFGIYYGFEVVRI